MTWSFRIGKIFGIDVFMHFTFLLLLGFTGLSHWLQTRDLAAALGSVGFFVALFACVLLHEFGHALAARRYGIQSVFTRLQESACPSMPVLHENKLVGLLTAENPGEFLMIQSALRDGKPTRQANIIQHA